MASSSPSSSVRRGIWCQLGDPLATRIAALSGADWICLDSQHGLFDRAALTASLAARGAGWAPVAVRTAALDAAEIGYALDAGADWVIVPLIETVEQARLAVSASFYPPLGRRSWGPLTPLWAGSAPTVAQANGHRRPWIMIETAAGLEAVEELVAVRGIGGVLVGPNDLALSLGVDQDELLADRSPGSPLQRILAAARRAGLGGAGAFGGDPVRGARMAEQGFGWVVVGTDVAALDAGARLLLA
jgi:4-hydroxy-2-oxoheptanedioate aldolase